MTLTFILLEASSCEDDDDGDDAKAAAAAAFAFRFSNASACFRASFCCRFARRAAAASSEPAVPLFGVEDDEEDAVDDDSSTNEPRVLTMEADSGCEAEEYKFQKERPECVRSCRPVFISMV